MTEEAAPPPDPWKSFAGVMAGTLILEVIVVLLFATAGILALAVLLLLGLAPHEQVDRPGRHARLAHRLDRGAERLVALVFLDQRVAGRDELPGRQRIELVRDLEVAHDSNWSRRLGAGADKDADAGQALQRLFVDDVHPGADVEAWDGELWSHVGALSERQQFVVVHRYVGQWTYPEIADRLGCSTAAARRCGADAIAALRHRLIPAREDT